jgi:aryl-alcohol dehydrogenase-like predicted oxidoreductase
MKTNQLGSKGPDLSTIGFGAWEAGGTSWGPNDSEDSVIGAINAAVDAGINWVDTAEVYGDGVSESLVGRAIAGRRDEVIVATKVAPGPEGSGFAPPEVARACRGSLDRLRIQHIDLYQLHWPDENGVALEDTWGAMSGLIDEGLVRWIGVSNFDLGSIERCDAIRHVDSLQPEFSMLNRENAELIRRCGELGTGVVTYGPLAFGLLTGTIDAQTTFAEGDWRGGDEGEPDDPDEVNLFDADNLPKVLAIVEQLRPIADRSGISLAQLALAWNVHQPGVTSAIAGSRSAVHVRDNADAGDIALSAETLAEVDALIAQVV